MVDKPCTYPGCRRLVPLGTRRCAQHRTAIAKARWQAADATRQDRPSRRWYKTKAWRRLREATLARDLNHCQWPGCGVYLTRGRARPTDAVVDHRVAHRDDHARFFDPDNLWALCKACHDTRKQSAERRGRGV